MPRPPWLHPLIRIEALVRVILTVRWNERSWPVAKVALRRLMRARTAIRREGARWS